MKLLVKKIILFSLPIIVYCAAIILIDPFNYFNISRLVRSDIKIKTSFPNNNFLWKCAEFRNSPCERILLGDSRTAAIDAGKIEKLTGLRYYNFAVNGATPLETIDIFWYAAGLVKLKTVYIGINFDAYNRFNGLNRFHEVKTIMDNPLFYLINKSVVKSVAYNVLSGLKYDVNLSAEPNMSREKFWKYQLESARIAISSKYGYPDQLYRSLTIIKKYCDENKIELRFIALPTHADAQKRVAMFNLQEQKERFYRDIRSLGPVADFDFSNWLTEDRNNFNDPYHLINTEILVREVWGPRPHQIMRHL